MTVMISFYRKLLRLEFWRWKHVNYQLIGLFALILVWDTATQLLLKVGLSSHGEFPVSSISAAWSYMHAIIREPKIWLGLLTLVLAFLTWLSIIARIDLSKAHPATSMSYVTVSIASAIFLHEAINSLKFIGIVVIIFGVYLVSE